MRKLHSDRNSSSRSTPTIISGETTIQLPRYNIQVDPGVPVTFRVRSSVDLSDLTEGPYILFKSQHDLTWSYVLDGNVVDDGTACEFTVPCSALDGTFGRPAFGICHAGENILAVVQLFHSDRYLISRTPPQ